MSYNTQIAELAIKTANGSFSNIVELSKILTIFGTQKDVKSCWITSCEANGLLKATANDYFSLAVIVGKIAFSDYKDAKASSVSVAKSRLDLLGIVSVKSLKDFKQATAKITPLVLILQGYRTVDGENEPLENVIQSCLESASLADKLLAIDKGEQFIANLPSDTAPSDTAPSDTAPSDTAPSDTAPSDTAPSDTAPSDTAPIDNEQMAMLLASVSLLTFAQCEKLEKILELRFEALKLQKVA